MSPSLALLLLAAPPPSATLTGAEGTLSWSISSSGGQVTITGASPKWSVRHVATAEMLPIQTERRDAEGRSTRVDYAADHAVVHLPEKDMTVNVANLWDGDTVDVRLGALAASGKVNVTFQGLDPASGSVYGFEAKTVGQEACGSAPCLHVHLGMTGVYRLVGPSWEYWFGPDGRLLRFQGPIGTYAAPGAL